MFCKRFAIRADLVHHLQGLLFRSWRVQDALLHGLRNPFIPHLFICHREPILLFMACPFSECLVWQVLSAELQKKIPLTCSVVALIVSSLDREAVPLVLMEAPCGKTAQLSIAWTVVSTKGGASAGPRNELHGRLSFQPLRCARCVLLNGFGGLLDGCGFLLCSVCCGGVVG